jgi:hypothetical protein
MATGESLRKQHWRAQIHSEMGIQFVGAELTEAVAGESRGVVHQKPYRRQSVGSAEDCIGAGFVRQLRNHFNRSGRDFVVSVVNMSDDRPAIRNEARRNDRADALSRSRDDRRSIQVAHDGPVVIARAPKQ